MRICHPGSVGGGYLFVSRVFNPLDYSYGGAAAVVVSAKGEAVGGDAAVREVMPANRYRSLILSLLHPFSVTPTTTVACCSAHVISVAGARGWPPPPPYGRILSATTVILTYVYATVARTLCPRCRRQYRRAHPSRHPIPLSYGAPLRHLKCVWLFVVSYT